MLTFSHEATGISSATRTLRGTLLGRQEEWFSQVSTNPLSSSSPTTPSGSDDCPALGALPDPLGLPEPQHQLVLREHVAYRDCLEAWRSTLDQSRQVLAKLFLQGTTVPRYWGTYTYRGEFYVVVLEDTGPKLKSFRDCNSRQRCVVVAGARSAPNL